MEPTNHDPRSGPDELPPRVVWLMAYLDGELGPDERARVESWIAQDAEAHHQVEEERRRRELFGAAQPPEPSPRAWTNALAGIESALRQAPPVGGRRPRTLWVIAGLTAAAVLAGVWIARENLPRPRPPAQPETHPDRKS